MGIRYNLLVWTYIGFGLVLPISSISQDFINNDLEGAVEYEYGILPPYWDPVPCYDPVSLASSNGTASPNLTDINGPVPDAGIMGNPYSGDSFVSGLRAPFFHEGIQQTVSGFNIGNIYHIGFYQSVVKQDNCTDTSGTWRVYRGDTFLGTVLPTISHEPAISLNMPWEYRTVTFTATSTSHVFKFMPYDDDSNLNHPNCLRMGIDSIFIFQDDLTVQVGHYAIPLPALYPNPTTGKFSITSGLTDFDRIEIIDVSGKIVHVEQPLKYGAITVDASSLEPAIYFVRVIRDGISSPGIRLAIEHP